MLHAIFDFGAFGVVETIHGADEVSGNATDTFTFACTTITKISLTITRQSSFICPFI